ncbi:MAG: hypothetical protein HGA44_17170 [Cellulomonadaceae bacterium]|nr:hypothetical protein [Cellulomonadaceae bacterium]
MADFEGVPLFGDVAGAGALLFLQRAPETDRLVRLEQGVEVATRIGVNAVVVRGLSAGDADALAGMARELANRGLDVLTMKASERLALAEEEKSANVLWWTDASGAVVLRLASSLTATLQVSLTGQALDADGNPVPPDPEPVSEWQESMRYFRMSELTDDLFDAFRNLYLAIESVLSKIHPYEAGGEGEWLKRALKVAGELVDLGPFATGESGNPVHDIYQELYKNVRNRVFHAKEGRQPYLPLNSEQRATVLEAKQRFGRLYLELASIVFGARFPVGGVSLGSAAREIMADVLARADSIGVTSESAPLNAADTALSSNGEPVAVMAVHVVPDLRGGEYRTLLGKISVAEMREQSVSSVGRYGTLTNEGAPQVVESLGGRLSLGGVDRCEFLIAVRVTGHQMRKERYAT